MRFAGMRLAYSQQTKLKIIMALKKMKIINFFSQWKLQPGIAVFSIAAIGIISSHSLAAVDCTYGWIVDRYF
jgi:hypothetical protein